MDSIKKILFIIGTRPEVIKCAPIILEFQKHPREFQTLVFFTGQHREIAQPIINFFQIKIDFNLNLMKPDQSLGDFTSESIRLLEKMVYSIKPDLIFVQGDTTTAFTGALAGYYNRIKVAHIEAGLRSGNRYSPFPEEGNRALISRITDYHFAPTESAANNLAKEGIRDNVWKVGNSAIDALMLVLQTISERGESSFYSQFQMLDFSSKIILITCHRRESFGKPFRDICEAIKKLASQFSDVQFVYPVHLNPKVQTPVHEILNGIKNVFLLEPLEYAPFVWLMSKSYLVLTDSGGIQEEAPSLKKPVLVMRDLTERMEGVNAGCARLVGTESEEIVSLVSRLLTDEVDYKKMISVKNPYGSGNTSKEVLSIISKNISL